MLACDSVGMHNTTCLMTRLDAARNMARFYLLSLEPDLFNGTALTRNWGRIGTRGQTRIELFQSADEAKRRLSSLASRKLRRGYRRIDEPG